MAEVKVKTVPSQNDKWEQFTSFAGVNQDVLRAVIIEIALQQKQKG